MTSRRVLITGSNRGIGLELARQYARGGAEVIATCRDPEHADELQRIDGRVRIERLDITAPEQLDALTARIADTPIDVLVNNAAVFGPARSRFDDVDWAAWRTVLDVNVVGNMRVAMALWRNVAASDERKIVFLSSRAGLPREASAGRSYVYTSSKAALNAAVRGLALDLAGEGVIVALLNPGHVHTRIGGAGAPMTVEESVTSMRELIAALTPADAGKFWHFDGKEIAL